MLDDYAAKAPLMLSLLSDTIRCTRERDGTPHGCYARTDLALMVLHTCVYPNEMRLRTECLNPSAAILLLVEVPYLSHRLHRANAICIDVSLLQEINGGMEYYFQNRSESSLRLYL